MSDSGRVAVIGGGPAGLAAALKLSEGQVSVLLIERDDRLGGRPIEFGCKATDRCAVCSACLVPQMARDALESPRVEVALGSEVTGFLGDPDERVVEFGGRAEAVEGVILATGYAPAEVGPVKPEYGLGKVPGVTTSVELDRRLRSGELLESPPGSLAFVQCAGSRDRAIGKDYCSRVCCTYALRAARAIHHRLPDVRLALFYQDLTPAGPGFDALVDECSGLARLVRALPAKIHREPGGKRPVVCYADTIDGALSEEPFDEVALSVGIWAGDNAAIDSLFDLERDEWGFATGSAHNRVLHAGACGGPVSIAESIEEGRVAAAEMLRRLSAGPRGTVALLGNDERCASLAEKEGFRAVPATGLKGVAGAFVAETPDGDVPVVGAIIPGIRADAQEEALPPHVRSIWSKHALERARSTKTLVILPDLCRGWCRAAHEDALALAAERASARQRTWIVVRHAFTGEPELEQLMSRAREAGTCIIHTDAGPTIDSSGVTVRDPGLGRDLTLKADIILAAPRLVPTDAQRAALRGLVLAGFRGHAVPLNPHLGLSATARLGIHVAGWLRDPGSSHVSARRSEDAAIAALTTTSRGSAEVDPEKCAICLTCVRECPHAAPVVTWNEERQKDLSWIQPEACAGCGVCVTLCPAQAITLAEFPDEPILAALEGANAG